MRLSVSRTPDKLTSRLNTASHSRWTTAHSLHGKPPVKQNRLERLLRICGALEESPIRFCHHPDVIDGGEDENEALLDEWPHGEFYGVPVWHMNESDERFIRLCNEYPRVAIGSCGDYDVKRPNLAVARMKDLIRHVIDEHGQPVTKLHGLRMLNPLIFTKLPLASADSTNVARNIGIDKARSGTYAPASKETRAALMVERIESYNSPGSLAYCEQRDRFNMQLQLAV